MHIYFTLYIPVICSIQVGHHGLLSTVVVGSTADAVGSVCQLLWLEQQLVLFVGSVVYCCGWNNSWCCWLCYQLLRLEQQLVVLTLLSTAVVETTADAVGSVVNCGGQKQQQFLAFYYIITQFTMQSLFSDY